MWRVYRARWRGEAAWTDQCCGICELVARPCISRLDIGPFARKELKLAGERLGLLDWTQFWLHWLGRLRTRLSPVRSNCVTLPLNIASTFSLNYCSLLSASYGSVLKVFVTVMHEAAVWPAAAHISILSNPYLNHIISRHIYIYATPPPEPTFYKDPYANPLGKHQLYPRIQFEDSQTPGRIPQVETPNSGLRNSYSVDYRSLREIYLFGSAQASGLRWTLCTYVYEP